MAPKSDAESGDGRGAIDASATRACFEFGGDRPSDAPRAGGRGFLEVAERDPL